MNAPARRPDARAALVHFYRSAEWVVLAAVVGAAILTAPQLRGNLSFHLFSAGWFLSILVLARLRWPVRNPTRRLIAGLLLSQLGIAAVLLYLAPALNGLIVVYVFFTTSAWLVLPRNQAMGFMVLACALSAGIALQTQPGISNVTYAAALCGCYVLCAQLAEIALRATARAATAAAAARGRDELTQIPGRQVFLRQAETFHQQALEKKIPYAIEIVDINKLRTINDTHGYAAGDRAIVLVAQALQRLRAPNEYLARYDGDKFVILVSRLDDDRAEDLARRIRSVVFSTTVNVDTEVVRIKANVGIAKYPVAGITLNALISAAERDVKLDQQGREPKGRKPVFRRRTGKMSA
jgi:diguanylate cyclase (GGDEF)-like protein